MGGIVPTYGPRSTASYGITESVGRRGQEGNPPFGGTNALIGKIRKKN